MLLVFACGAAEAVDINDSRLAFGVNIFFPFADAGGDKIVLIVKIFSETRSVNLFLFESSFKDCVCPLPSRKTIRSFESLRITHRNEFKKTTAHLYWLVRSSLRSD